MISVSTRYSLCHTSSALEEYSVVQFNRVPIPFTLRLSDNFMFSKGNAIPFPPPLLNVTGFQFCGFRDSTLPPSWLSFFNDLITLLFFGTLLMKLRASKYYETIEILRNISNLSLIDLTFCKNVR